MLREHPEYNRTELSRRVCQRLHWLKPDGGLKDMSCRVALLRMQKDGLLTLPKTTHGHYALKAERRLTSATDPPGTVLETPVGALRELHLQQVVSRTESSLWNEFIDRYHYLGYSPLPGAQLRYFVYAGGTPIALFGFGAAAWHLADRDRFIGWTAEQCKARLHLLVNNARYLILPWVRSRNLASYLLARVVKQLPVDWEARYKYRPVLLETFVEIPRHTGTCYKAANWHKVGETRGRGKLGPHQAQLPRKSIWVYPLRADFKEILSQEHTLPCTP
jgi:hypothetical protein